MQFDILSPREDFKSKLQSDLQNINKNVLYVTHQVDMIKKLLQEIRNDKALQTQVDDYLERDDAYPNEDKEPD